MSEVKYSLEDVVIDADLLSFIRVSDWKRVKDFYRSLV